jgi:hypothetical protein
MSPLLLILQGWAVLPPSGEVLVDLHHTETVCSVMSNHWLLGVFKHRVMSFPPRPPGAQSIAVLSILCWLFFAGLSVPSA